MNKILLIIKREYLTRVKKKSFIIMTIIGPILFGALFVIPIWLATRDSDDVKTVEVYDESEKFVSAFENSDNLKFTSSAGLSFEDALVKAQKNDNLFLYIPTIDIENPEGFKLIAGNSPGVETESRIKRAIEKRIEELKMEKYNISKETLAAIKTDIKLKTEDFESKESNSWLFSGIGYIASFLIYFFIFLYGAQIMRGVIEEKSNRIVEVIISSVKPFQLMIGKVVGIAAVGLTQFLLWVVFSTLVYTIVLSVAGLDPSQAAEMNAAARGQDLSGMQESIADISSVLSTLNIPLLLVSFIFYFLAGYLMYGALFAAVGSAVDSDADAQQFMLPITIPLIASIVSLTAVLKDPNGTLAFWLSIIPFTSPIVMMTRLPFGVPTWELILSMVLLVGGFLFSTWLAGRIYRIGILMHGTKVNYKTLGKWLTMKY